MFKLVCDIGGNSSYIKQLRTADNRW